MFRTLLYLLVATVAVADLFCPEGAISSVDRTRCYHPLFFKFKFWDAEKVCNAFGGHLASVGNSLQNSVVSGYFSDKFWLGGVKLNVSWSWTDEDAMSYTSWAAGEPSKDSYRRCLMADHTTGLWVAAGCDTRAFFLCETKASGTNSSCPTCSCPTCATFPPTVAPTAHTVPVICPVGSVCTENNEFRFISIPTPWYTAETNCRNVGGNLASFHSREENEIVDRLFIINNQLSAWLGGQLNELGVSSWWDKTPWNFSYWMLGCGFNNLGHTVCLMAYQNNGWCTSECGMNLPYICKIPLR